MSRRRPTRPLMRYSLWPERYKRRVTTTSPGLVASMGLSPPFLRRLPLRNSGALADVSSGCAEESCDSGVSCCDSGAGAGSSERIWTFGSSVAVNSPCGGLATSAAASICAEGFVALLAQHPGNGVYHVGFAAAVGADDTGRTGTAKSDHGAFAKGLKANDFHFSKLKQGVPFWSSTDSRRCPV